MRIVRPMLACSRNVWIKDLQSLQYPMFVSTKQDGVRCRLDQNDEGDIVAMSRALKPLPNCHIQSWAENLSNFHVGLDGEIVIPGMKFNDIQSWVMSGYTGPKQFEFRVFDIFHSYPFIDRYELLLSISDCFDKRAKLLKQMVVFNPKDIECQFEYVTDHGEEGLILRSPSGLYKSGRSTWNQAYSLKMKKFEDGEGIIVGYYPLSKNENPSVLNELGLKKKSSHQDNKILQNLLGGWIVQTREFGTIRVGSGPTLAQRKRWWKRRTTMVGEEVTFQFQRHGMKDKPRTATLKSINSLLQ